MPGLLSPIPHRRVTQEFDGDHDFEPRLFLASDELGARRARARAFPNSLERPHLHGAIDISCPIGTAVTAPQRGRVAELGTYESTGENYMMLEIRPGTILFFTHLSAFVARKNQVVEQGSPIPLSGNSGRSTGPHLHWEVRVTTRPNPNPRKSGRWFKLNPRRLHVGGDLAELLAIQPLVARSTSTTDEAPRTDLVVPVDPDDDDPEEDTAPEDAVGDVGLEIERAAPVARRIGGPLEF